MNKKDKEGITELKTHVMYIRENIKEMNNKLNGLPCNPHEKRLTILEGEVGNAKEKSNWSTKKTVAIIGALASIISALISAAIATLL